MAGAPTPSPLPFNAVTAAVSTDPCQQCYWVFKAPPGFVFTGGTEIVNGCQQWIGAGLLTGPCYGVVGKTPSGAPFNMNQWAEAWSDGIQLDALGRTFGLNPFTMGWALVEGPTCSSDAQLNFFGPPIACCPLGSIYDPGTEACVPFQENFPLPPPFPIPGTDSKCVIPCWLSCAPSWIQYLWCVVVGWLATECDPAQAAICIGLLSVPALDPLGIECLKGLVTSCTASLVIDAANGLIAWLGGNPFGCPNCSSPPPSGRCAAPSHLPPCAQGEALNAAGCCVDPPLPYINVGSIFPTPLETNAIHIERPAEQFVLPAPNVQPPRPPLGIPVPTSAIAVTACATCGDAALEEMEV
jgi:hypothetical protein